MGRKRNEVLMETVNVVDGNTIEVVKTTTSLKTYEDLSNELAQLEQAKLDLDQYYEEHSILQDKKIIELNSRLALVEPKPIVEQEIV